MTPQTKSAGALLGLLALGCLSGCSVIGAGLGALIDHARPPAQVRQVTRLQEGTRLKVWMRDGTVRKGRFRGLEPSWADYSERCARVLPPDTGQSIPQMGIPIKLWGSFAAFKDAQPVRGRGRRELNDRLLGFDPNAVLIGTDSKTSRRVPLEKIDTMEVGSQRFDAADIERLLVQGRVAQVSQLRLDDCLIPLEQIQRLDSLDRQEFTIAGTLVGAAVDAWVLFSLQNLGIDGTLINTTSCPLIYSFQGSKYVLDAEPLGGALFPSAQRTDWERLDHLHEREGSYRLKVTNEQREIEFLDELKLWVVDGPDATEIVPSLKGDLETFSNPVAPVSAHDLDGNNARAFVQARDGEFWIGNPLGRDPRREKDRREGLILEFPRPPNRSIAKLAFTVRSTAWASTMLRTLLELQGREATAWYTRIDRDPSALREFQEARVREALPHISIWSGGSWREVGFLANVGPWVWRDQALRLTLPPDVSGFIRIKVEGPAGFWMFDRVAADYSPNTPLHITELSPSSALDTTHGDVRGLLAQIDKHHYTMAESSAAELVFPALAPTTTLPNRSFFVKASGHYKVLLDGRGEPNQALFDRLLREPGALGRFNLEQLAESLEQSRMAAQALPSME